MTTGDLSTTFTLDTDLVVDAAYFTVAEIRAEYPELADTTKYPDAKIDTVRERAEHAFEDAAGIAFIPRDTTETLDGTGGNVLHAPLAARPVGHHHHRRDRHRGRHDRASARPAPASTPPPHGPPASRTSPSPTATATTRRRCASSRP
jgi:hypothetical protein